MDRFSGSLGVVAPTRLQSAPVFPAGLSPAAIPTHPNLPLESDDRRRAGLSNADIHPSPDTDNIWLGVWLSASRCDTGSTHTAHTPASLGARLAAWCFAMKSAGSPSTSPPPVQRSLR